MLKSGGGKGARHVEQNGIMVEWTAGCCEMNASPVA